jgi:hypothetical protein
MEKFFLVREQESLIVRCSTGQVDSYRVTELPDNNKRLLDNNRRLPNNDKRLPNNIN